VTAAPGPAAITGRGSIEPSPESPYADIQHVCGTGSRPVTRPGSDARRPGAAARGRPPAGTRAGGCVTGGVFPGGRTRGMIAVR
jgi:hypothetical protein